MRQICTLIFLLVLMSSFAQNTSELLIFNADGASYIKRGNTKITSLSGEQLMKNDWLYVVNGAVTIINRSNKKITVNSNGKYSFNAVQDLMTKAEASLTNRYFVNVWDQMNDKHENANYRGGVVRGNAVPSFPVDSAFILSDSVCFEYFSTGSNPDGISIKNNLFRELFYTPLDTNSVVMALSAINNAEAGVYFYEFDGNPSQCFIIPDFNEKAKLLDEFNKNLDKFSNFNDKMKTMLLMDYMIENKVYVFFR